MDLSRPGEGSKEQTRDGGPPVGLETRSAEAAQLARTGSGLENTGAHPHNKEITRFGKKEMGLQCTPSCTNPLWEWNGRGP